MWAFPDGAGALLVVLQILVTIIYAYWQDPRTCNQVLQVAPDCPCALLHLLIATFVNREKTSDSSGLALALDVSPTAAAF